MKSRLCMFSGITNKDRHQVIADVSKAISSNGGWIVNHEMYSNIAVMIRFNIEPKELAGWREGICVAGVRLDPETIQTLEDRINHETDRDEEVACSLNVTFIHNEPDVRQPIPAVPG